MKPEKRMKKNTKQALATWTISFVRANVANTKRSSFIKMLKVMMMAIKVR